MKKKESILLLAGMFLMIVLAGCQSESADLNQAADNQAKPVNTNLPDGEYGKPYSKGPTSSPEESLKGPTAPPPAAQAVTTNENIRLTLPKEAE
jgi:hypothetical protein